MLKSYDNKKWIRSYLFHFILFLTMYSVISCADHITDVGSANEDFQRIWRHADTSYVFFDLKGIDWNNVYQDLSPRADRAEGDEIVSVLIDLLAQLKDPHVTLSLSGEIFGGEIVPFHSHRSRRDRDAFSLIVVKNLLNTQLESSANDRVFYGVTGDNIGYIYLAEFSEPVLGGFTTAMSAVRSTDGLIVDVRANTGGSLGVIVSAAGRFTPESFPGIPIFNRGKRVTSPEIAPTGDFRYLNPVVLMHNGTSVSAAESFSEMMKQIPTVTAVGDTTAGGGGSFSPEASGILLLTGDRSAKIPVMDIRHYDETPVEWLGVAPDIRVEQNGMDIAAGDDPRLEMALSLLGSQ